MKREVTKRAVMTFVSVCLFLAMMPVAAFSWGDATHAYISDRLKARVGYKNINEMWGSLGADIFNYIFDETLCPGWLAEQTHGRPGDSFMKVWDAAGTRAEKALALGFVSHNELWGADFTAHISGLTFGPVWGYINTKAMELLNTPLYPDQPKLGEILGAIGLTWDKQMIVAHVITEYAIDMMLRNDVDPYLGLKLGIAAHARSKKFPALLVEAYAADYVANCHGIDYSTAASIITLAEAEYRKGMIFYGHVISRPEPIAVKLIAEQIVALASGFLGEGFSIPENAPEIIEQAAYNAMTICSDYLAEIDATVDYVGDQLVSHGITY